jgi:hypothetical protein
MKELRFRRVRILPLLPRFTAITTPWGICYHKVPLTERLRRHERCHWLQYQRHGRLRFSLLYLWESIRRGYWANRFEVEARAAEAPADRKGSPQ